MSSDYFYDKLGVGSLPVRTKRLVRKYLFLILPANSLFMLSNTFFILFIIDSIGYVEASFLLAINFIIHAVLDYPTGIIGDWIGQRWILFFAYLGYSVAFLLLASYFFYPLSTVLLISYIVFAISSSQESGGFQAWFDNNFKVSVEGNDVDRIHYRAFRGKSRLLFDVSGGLMIILGGLLSTTFNRELVFGTQAIGLFSMSFIILIYTTDFPEIIRQSLTLKSYISLLKEGLVRVASKRSIFLLLIADVLYTVPILIYFDLTLFPIYFGYTGSDLGASIFRFSLFYIGAVGVWFVTDWVKRIDISAWIPRIQIFHTFSFYGGLALLLFVFPIKNSLNLIAVVLVGLIIFITHITRVAFGIIIQRIYLDVIDDETRNGFYSLRPTLHLIVSSPLIALAGIIVETFSFSSLFICLGCIALFGTVAFIYSSRILFLENKFLCKTEINP